MPTQNNSTLLKHGGKLNQIAVQYDIPLDQWLDLSTGVNPRCYPVKPVSVEAWNRLPEDDDGLIEIAQKYYQCSSLLPVAGTQAAIQTLPILFLNSFRCIAIPAVGYKEHGHAWRQNGYDVITYDQEPTEDLINNVDALLVINPNNPSTHTVSASQLLDWHQQLQKRNGYLIVDEAFTDSQPEQSISHLVPREGLIVLRSIGKFFGLAGIRAGFVLAESELLHRMQVILGPWTLSGPSREVCKQALRDTAWHKQNRNFLTYASERLNTLLSRYFEITFHTTMFATVMTENALEIHRALCSDAVFTRLLDEQNGLRFGLPDSEPDWQQLSKALLLIREP